MGRDGMIFGIEDAVEYTDNTNMRSTEMTNYSRLIHMVIYTALKDLKSKKAEMSDPAWRWLYHPDSDELSGWVGLDMDMIREHIEGNPDLSFCKHGLRV